jgi:hypothetical protein
MRLLIVGGMLTPTVSASVTPANAGGGFCGNYGIQGVGCPGNSDAAVTARAHMFGVSRSLVLESCCFFQCNKEMNRRLNTETRTSNSEKSQACSAKCVNEFEARRR